MVPKLGRQIGRARSMLDLLNDVLVACSGNLFSVIADKDVQLGRLIWHQLYNRLGLDVPFPRFPVDPSSEDSTSAGRRLTFGWLESVPGDLGLKTCWPISSRFLFKNYQERCDQGPQLKKRIERCRDVLELIRLQSLSVDCVLGDNEIAFHQDIWLRIYNRLGLEVPFPRFFNGRADNDKVAGRRLTFGWLESLPFDMDSQGEWLTTHPNGD